MADFGWLDWQLNFLDDFILGYSTIATQQELADTIGKSLNAVKIKISRRKSDLSIKELRKLTPDEYVKIIANRFDKTTAEVAEMIGVTESYLLEEMDELDALECKEWLCEDFISRPLTFDEVKIFLRLYNKERNKFAISHILNRPITFIEEMIKVYVEEANIRDNQE